MTKVINAGSPGDGTKVFLGRLDDILSLAAPPATVVLSIGANDCINPRMAVPFPEFRKNLRTIYRTIRERGFQLINIVPPLIVFGEFLRKYPEMKTAVENGLEDEYLKYVDFTRELSAGEKIPFLDLYRVFAAVSPGEPEESLTRNKSNCGAHDGLHPTPHGHILIGAMLFTMIRDLGLPQERILCTGDSLTHGYPLAGMGTVDGDNYPSALRRLFATF